MRALMIGAAIWLALALVAAIPILTPCPTEDSTLCNWNASEHGNGHGASYVALTEDLWIYY